MEMLLVKFCTEEKRLIFCVIRRRVCIEKAYLCGASVTVKSKMQATIAPSVTEAAVPCV
jgi:hypothetical protein